MNFNINLVFKKNEYFWGVMILWIFLGGHHIIGLYLGVISMHFMVFSYGKGTEWVIFNFVAKMSNIYLECLKILIFFG